MSKIDQCEDDKATAAATNIEATRVLASCGCRFIYFSTDAVFDGLKGNYDEDDEPYPVNFYGESKLLGERIAMQSNSNCLVLRTSMYGYNINKNISLAERVALNLIDGKPMKAFTDSVTNPLYTKQVTESVRYLLHTKDTGILHLGSDRIVSKYEFFSMIASVMQLSCKTIEPSSIEDVKFRVERTKNTSLSVENMHRVLHRKFSLDDVISQFFNDYLKWAKT